ncbi:MAG TPA: hypothetical protein VNC84_03370 [Gammaproteobacteria bacterium]|jgi:hypothetical protein|nr:hypothetical protein [Gammaproteobacteria bacterium]
MPQITLFLSHRVNLSLIDCRALFKAIHAEVGRVPGVDIESCSSGVIQEAYSYIGLGDEKLAKVYLDIGWLEREDRLPYKAALAKNLMALLQEKVILPIQSQGLQAKPRVRIINLGLINQDYYIGS